MFKPMRLETIERRAVKRRQDAAERRLNLLRRLRLMVVEHGPMSLWAELLTELEGANIEARKGDTE